MADCALCNHALEHGSWPQTLLNKGGTHCSTQYTNDGSVFLEGCHRTWTASREAHCLGTNTDGNACHLHFSADSVANKHRKNGVCLTLDETLALRVRSEDRAPRPVVRLVESTDGRSVLSSFDVKPLKAAWA